MPSRVLVQVPGLCPPDRATLILATVLAWGGVQMTPFPALASAEIGRAGG
jgi:hypothetical protein